MSPHDDFTKCRRTMSTPNVIAYTQGSPLPVLSLTGRAPRSCVCSGGVLCGGRSHTIGARAVAGCRGARKRPQDRYRTCASSGGCGTFTRVRLAVVNQGLWGRMLAVLSPLKGISVVNLNSVAIDPHAVHLAPEPCGGPPAVNAYANIQMYP